MTAPADSALVDPVIVGIAARLGGGVTPAQVVLAWHLRRGVSCVPKSSRPERLAENLAAEDVAPRLTDKDIRGISALDKHRRFNDPGVFTQFMNSFAPIFD
jgi:D-xylose reductase